MKTYLHGYINAVREILALLYFIFKKLRSLPVLEKLEKFSTSLLSLFSPKKFKAVGFDYFHPLLKFQNLLKTLT